MDRSPRPALDVRLPAAPASLLPRLDALLDDYAPFAIQDARDGTESDPEAGVPTTAVDRRVYFFSADARDAARRAIDRTLGSDGARTTPLEVSDDGWAARAHASLRAVRVGDLVVAPPWDVPSPPSNARTVVVIEPSMGFGTGHHASTRLCLLALQRVRDCLPNSRRVLDLGAGSGVLAITAAVLGAKTVVAVERDPDALGNMRENIRHNRVEERTTVVAGDLADVALDAGDVVTANLTGAFFVRHAARVLRCVQAHGILIASGITTDEEHPVRAALEPPLTLRERTAEDDWVGLVFERSSASVPTRTRT